MMFVLWRISALNSNTLYFSTQSWTGNWHALISFRLRVLTGVTHIFGLRQKSRQEADPSSLLAASTSSLPLPNLQIRIFTINTQTAIRMVRKVAGRATVTALLLSTVSVWLVLYACVFWICLYFYLSAWHFFTCTCVFFFFCVWHQSIICSLVFRNLGLFIK